MCKPHRLRLLHGVLPAFLLIITLPSSAGPVFLGLGDLPGGQTTSSAYAVSADGTVVVGQSGGPLGGRAFRWTLDTGMVSLGDLPGGISGSLAWDVSGDGSVVVGLGSSEAGFEAFRWTQVTGIVGLGDLPGGPFSSVARGVSADGSAIVGTGYLEASGKQAFRWTAADGMVGLGTLFEGALTGGLVRISGDGSVVVGTNLTSADSSEARTEAFRWTQESGMVGIGDLPGGAFSSTAMDISQDGRVIVGTSLSDNGTEAFRWTQQEGMVSIGDFTPYAVSADGSQIVGLRLGTGPVLWDAHNGTRVLEELLESDLGLDLAGWSLGGARDISADGRVIVGTGLNPLGQPEGWIVVIPEPATCVLLAVGLLPAVTRRRRSRPRNVAVR